MAPRHLEMHQQGRFKAINADFRISALKLGCPDVETLNICFPSNKKIKY
jgi:hypothetical protein